MSYFEWWTVIGLIISISFGNYLADIFPASFFRPIITLCGPAAWLLFFWVAMGELQRHEKMRKIK